MTCLTLGNPRAHTSKHSPTSRAEPGEPDDSFHVARRQGHLGRGGGASRVRADAAARVGVMARILITEFMDEAAVDQLRAAHDVLYDAKLVDDGPRLNSEASLADAIVVRNRTQVRG